MSTASSQAGSRLDNYPQLDLTDRLTCLDWCNTFLLSADAKNATHRLLSDHIESKLLKPWGGFQTCTGAVATMQYQSADKLPLYKTAEDHGGADLGGFVEVNFVKLKEADSTKPNIAQARQDADEEVGNDNCTKYFTNTDIASRLTELQRSHTAFKTRALGATA